MIKVVWFVVGVVATFYAYLLTLSVRARLAARRWRPAGPLYRVDLSLDRTAHPDHDEWHAMRRQDHHRPIETIDPL